MKGRIVDKKGCKEYYLDGRRVSEEEFRAVFPEKEIGWFGGQLPSCWPMVSEALAVHAKQAEAANERARRHGINVHYDARGDCHIPDRNERKKLLRLERMHDNNGGYGD